MLKIFILISLFITQSAQAIPEASFELNWQNEVAPYFARGHQRTFHNRQGLKLNYYSFTSHSNLKTLVVLPGRTEPAIKYAELVYDLKDQGYNIYILDHQGQGASDRRLNDLHKGYVKHFSDYVQDFSDWLEEVVIPETINQERFLLAHSMGGTIATLYLAKSNEVFKKAILTSPMMQIDTKPYTEPVGRALTSLLVGVGLGKKYAPGKGPYIHAEDTFEHNEVTHSTMRFNMSKNIFLTWPELILGGPTNRWVNQSLKITKNINSLSDKIRIPLLLLQSGKDLVVKPARQTLFCGAISNCQLIHFTNAYHEIFQESDEIRNKAMRETISFLEN
jgi:lysophospholipase